MNLARCRVADCSLLAGHDCSHMIGGEQWTDREVRFSEELMRLQRELSHHAFMAWRALSDGEREVAIDWLENAAHSCAEYDDREAEAHKRAVRALRALVEMSL